MTDRDEIIRAINTLTKAGYVVVPPDEKTASVVCNPALRYDICIQTGTIFRVETKDGKEERTIGWP